MAANNIGATVARIIREQIDRLRAIAQGTELGSSPDLEGVEQQLASAALLAEQGDGDGSSGNAAETSSASSSSETATATQSPAESSQATPSDQTGQSAAAADVGTRETTAPPTADVNDLRRITPESSSSSAPAMSAPEAAGSIEDRLAEIEDRVDRLEHFVGLLDPNRRARATIEASRSSAAASAPQASAGGDATPTDHSGRNAAAAGVGGGR